MTKTEDTLSKPEVLHVSLWAPAQVVIGERTVDVVSFDCDLYGDGPLSGSSVIPDLIEFYAVKLYGRRKSAKMKVTIHVPVTNIASIVRQVKR